MDDGILINIPQRMLFYFRKGELLAAYPVGLGKPKWPTPEAEFKIISMETHKAWLVPQSIQEEMRCEQKAVREEVPPGPDNPLGAHWLGQAVDWQQVEAVIAAQEGLATEAGRLP